MEEWGNLIVAPKPKAPLHCKPEKAARVARDQVHGLIRGARSHFENGKPVGEGTYLKPYKKLLVDVIASQASLNKALNLANDLFNALESVGHRVVPGQADAELMRRRIDEREVETKRRDHWQYNGLWSPYRPTVVYVGPSPSAFRSSRCQRMSRCAT
jgi:hypothetical protein